MITLLLFCLVNADCHIIDYEKLATQTPDQYDYILGQCDQATHQCSPQQPEEEHNPHDKSSNPNRYSY